MVKWINNRTLVEIKWAWNGWTYNDQKGYKHKPLASLAIITTPFTVKEGYKPEKPNKAIELTMGPLHVMMARA